MTVFALIQEAECHNIALLVDDGNLRWKAPVPPPAELLTRLKTCKLEIMTALTEQRVTALKNAPPVWLDGVAIIQTMSPPLDWSERRWPATVSGAIRFVERWGSQAAALGWTTRELFGCHPVKSFARLDCLGLALSLDRSPVVALTAESARLQQTTFTRLHPTQIELAVLMWRIAA